QPDGTPCGSAAMSECNAADSCLAGACVPNEAPAGAVCYDCALGGGMCASCSLGTCADATCAVSAAPRGAELLSPIVANNGDEGNMFDVVATQTITITSFETHATQAGMTEYEIWTKLGTFVGAEADRDQWTRVGTATFELSAQGAFSPIPIPINITINAGQRRAFYLTNKILNNRYHNGTSVGAVLTSTPELTLHEGAGVNWGTNGFGAANTPRAWEGKIHYKSGGGASLATTMAGTLTGSGVMFDVAAKADIKTTLLAVHLAPGTHEADVYFKRGTHAGAQAMQWERLAKLPNVISSGASTPTILPLPVEVFLDAGTTTAFYIASTAPLRFEAGTAVGMPAATNAEMTIAQGVSLTSLFGMPGGPVIPNVELGYGLCN
ncbi:MAG TPA: hypothetical protein VFO79_12620, partial [Xanthomonadales bacterium]|nr:hypothetical protein [Xanthomonadales bacterium]